MNFKSIKGRMLTVLIILVTLTCFGLSGVSYYMSKKALESSTKNLMQQISEQAAKNIDLSIQSNFSVLESVSDNEMIKDAEIPWEKKKKILDEEIKSHGHLVLGIADKEGNIVYSDGNSNNIKDRDYFKGAMEGKNTVSEPFVSKIDNTNLFMPYAVPIRNNGEVVGALVALRDGNDLGKSCTEIKFEQTGQAYIIGKTGDVIAHKNRELVLKKDNVQKSSKEDKGLESLAAIERDMMAGRTGVGEYSYNKVAKFIGYAPIGTTGWSIGIFIEKKEALAAVDNIRLNGIIISIVSIVLAVVVVWIMSNILAKSLNYIKGHIDNMAKGDLSLSLDERYLKMENEIGDMARSLESSRKSIASMIDSIKVNSDTIDSQATSLASISEEFTASTQNISAAIQQVATGSSTQAEELSNIVSLLQQFGVELDDAVKSIGDIDLMSKEVSNKANMSNEDMEKVVSSVERLTESFYDFAKKISTMSQNIQKVNEITDLINSIAEQTNLLALNAAIEAARAGEAGRGFAVVAEEIRGLAERSKESSENIYVLINSVLEDANKMVTGTDSMNQELQNQRASIDTAIESFKTIATSILNIEPKIGEVTSTAHSIDKKKNSILEKTEAISSISEEISASSQEIAASSEQMSSSSLEVSNAAEKLNTMTDEMLNKVNEFKI